MKHAVLFLLPLFAAPLSAQSGGLNVRFSGAAIDIRTVSTGPNLPLSTSGTTTVPDGQPFHRLVFSSDPVDGVPLLGYDIEARPLGQGAYGLRIKPISNVKVGGRGKWLEIPTLAAARDFPPLRAGDSVEVDILLNPATRERIYDVLTLAAVAPPPAAPPAERFSLKSPRVSVAGISVREPREVWMTGAALGIDLPGEGRFYFSLAPPPGLPAQPAAWVDHNILRFHAGSDLVEISAESNVLDKSEFATVWVYSAPIGDTRREYLRDQLEAARKTYSPNHPTLRALEARLLALNARTHMAGESVEFICGDSVQSLTNVKGPW